MSIRVNIEAILKSRDEVFKSILLKITSKVIQNAKSELKTECCSVDQLLFDAIILILKNLESEESYISRLLYRLFGFEFKENVQRRQLIILGSELKSQYMALRRDIDRVKVNLENISHTASLLQKLKKAFRDKILFLSDRGLVEKANFYMDRIDRKMDELARYGRELDDRLSTLEKVEREYKSLIRKIPRYHELNSRSDPILENKK